MDDWVERPEDTSSARAKYRLGHLINTAWLADSAASRHVSALEAGWDALAEDPEWRAWVREHLIPADPFLYLAIRDDLDRRRMLKTKSGVSVHVPIAEVLAAEESGELVKFFAALIGAIYAKWASGADCPAPPMLPEHL
ncbi:hypothetical protein KG112_18185 [Nocardioides sp. zg-ZUI104]|uniref:hypothetical protein n=1 Tax=Nocardioides faecalis TaxID=2803858 RepID=UPI001BCB5740|nr:hypothetical protein [Nocardioides faecalis]MBS4754737.1 hypothetical protein [Nocardioides faecalis]